MQKLEYGVTTTLVAETCCNCGTPFAMASGLYDQLQRTGKSFYCPNGHSQHYTETTENKLKKAEQDIKSLEDQAKWWRGEAEAKAKQLSATRGQLTKTKKRLAGGACPCCHRQFVSLQRHMTTKHPGYAVEVTNR